jgi:hypothetical protein
VEARGKVRLSVCVIACSNAEGRNLTAVHSLQLDNRSQENENILINLYKSVGLIRPLVAEQRSLTSEETNVK